MEHLKLIKPSIEYKEAGIDYVNEHYVYNSPINGCGGLNRYLNDYEGWLKKIENDISNPDPGRVHSLSYYLVRESDNKIVGMVNIRLELNERLLRCGGNIGYGIRPSERRKGYNKINLYLALEICQNYGLEEILLDCNANNIGSKKSMEALGGILVSDYIDREEGHCLKYKINVSKSLKEYYNLYNQEESLKKER